MSTEKTDALVIRIADFSETSRVVTLFTRDFGKVSAVAKGGRRLKGPFEGALDLLSRSRIVFIRKSTDSLDILTEAKLSKRFMSQSRSLGAFYAGCYVAELLSGLTEEYDPHPILFDAAIAALKRLDQETDHKLTLIRFQLALLREIGQLPEFETCIVCSNPTTGSGPFSYWARQGGLLCPQCQTRESSSRIPAGTVAILRRLALADTVAERLSISSQQLAQIQQLLQTAVSHALGRRPKTLRYLDP